MQDLRLVERREQTLILETEDGAEFYLDVNEEIIGVVQAIARALAAKGTDTKVRPREVQALLRSGLSRNEVAKQLDVSSEDVERYAGPIDAEFSFIMEQVRGVAVRATGGDGDTPQRFGEVIEDRLNQLGADDFTWSTWKDAEDGWIILLLFSAHGVDHEARWKFDHRKRLLTPVTPDAINLSKQGDVGDKLIPTLRAVDIIDDRPSFDAALTAEEAPEPAPTKILPQEEISSPVSGHDHEQILPDVPLSDFERRQGIEQRAIVSEPEPQDLGQTSDLLDALRKRRHDRVQEPETETATPDKSSDLLGQASQTVEPPAEERSINIWGSPVTHSNGDSSTPALSTDPQQSELSKPDDKKSKKGRTSIPSWDEILFGTRSDDE